MRNLYLTFIFLFFSSQTYAELSGSIGIGSFKLDIDSSITSFEEREKNLNLSVDKKIYCHHVCLFLGLGIDFLDEINQNFLDQGGQGQLKNFTVDTKAINLGMKISVPLSREISIFASYGLSYWESDLTSSGQPRTIQNTDFKNTFDGTDDFIGFGVDYSPNNHKIGIHYKNLEVEIVEGGFNSKFDLSDISLVWSFPLANF